MAKILIFVLALAVCLCDAHRWWRWHNKLRLRSCPEDDESRHECYDLRNLNITLSTCPPGDSSEDGDSSEEDDDDSGSCSEVRIIMYYCDRHCCEGWERDEKGWCSISSNANITCYNGGTAFSTQGESKCVCRQGFSGKQCETPFCSPQCQNGGVCRGHMGRPSSCVCLSGYTGSSCEKSICDDFCQNGGTCTLKNTSPWCTCPVGYEGLKCEKVVKPGKCPASSLASTTDYSVCRRHHCRQDGDCRGVDKCCWVRHCKGRRCMTPVNMTCYYKGHYYPMGQDFHPDSCTACKCQGPNKTYCDVTICPVLSCEDTYKPPGECCAKCKDPDEEVKPDEYKDPYFPRCPQKMVSIFVGSDVSYAILRLDMEAQDFKGKSLKIQGPPIKHFPAFQGTGRLDLNVYEVKVVSEPDEYGGFAKCDFLVKVKDRHPPRFISCPADIYAWDDEIIEWEEPIVEDNVGIAIIELISDNDQHATFPIGEHVVTYVAQDFRGNEARCMFMVNVMSDDDESTWPMELRMRKEEGKHRLMLVAAPVGGVVLLVIVVIAIACLCRRRKPARRRCSRASSTGSTTSGDPSRVDGFDNGIYAIYGRPPPSYDSYPRKKASSDDVYEKPPAYDEIKERAYDNPIYSHDEKKQEKPIE